MTHLLLELTDKCWRLQRHLLYSQVHTYQISQNIKCTINVCMSHSRPVSHENVCGFKPTQMILSWKRPLVKVETRVEHTERIVWATTEEIIKRIIICITQFLRCSEEDNSNFKWLMYWHCETLSTESFKWGICSTVITVRCCFFLVLSSLCCSQLYVSFCVLCFVRSVFLCIGQNNNLVSSWNRLSHTLSFKPWDAQTLSNAYPLTHSLTHAATVSQQSQLQKCLTIQAWMKVKHWQFGWALCDVELLSVILQSVPLLY